MKGGDRDAILPAIFIVSEVGQHACDALFHFAGGFVGEGYSQNISGCDAFADHVGDAASNHAGLSGAGAGEDQDRAFDRVDSKALLRVQGTQVKHRGEYLKSTRGRYKDTRSRKRRKLFNLFTSAV